MTRTKDFQSVHWCGMMPGNPEAVHRRKAIPRKAFGLQVPCTLGLQVPCTLRYVCCRFCGVFHSLAVAARLVRWRWGLAGSFAEGCQEFALPYCQLFGFLLEVA